MKVELHKWLNVVEHIGTDTIMLNAFLIFKTKLNYCDWQNLNDVKQSLGSADVVTCKEYTRLIFNVGGNKYRLICGIHFSKTKALLYVRFVGTHSEYDKIDVCNINMF